MLSPSLEEIYPSDQSYEMEKVFLKKFHSKMKDNGLEAKIDSFEQAGFPGCFAYRLNIPKTICESYGGLSHHFSGAIFDLNPLYMHELTALPNFDVITNKIAQPELVKLISENVKYFELGTTAEINKDLQLIYFKNTGKADSFSFDKKSRSLRVSYDFFQENDNLVEELTPYIKRSPILRLWGCLKLN